jgi:hypothetical protein
MFANLKAGDCQGGRGVGGRIGSCIKLTADMKLTLVCTQCTPLILYKINHIDNIAHEKIS